MQADSLAVKERIFIWILQLFSMPCVGEAPSKLFCIPLWCEYSFFNVTLLLHRSVFNFWIPFNSAQLKAFLNSMTNQLCLCDVKAGWYGGE